MGSVFGVHFQLLCLCGRIKIEKKDKLYLPLIPMLAVTGYAKHWPSTKKGIIYTEILQEEKISPMIPRSDNAFSEIFCLEASPVESQ